ncbi:Mctp1 [Symbiodinium natans]|uniref:Mctp1 protein n=1 Tax=Symbiodinium natans TaxID=878477 RepID=A0A812U955_9DINO|nr:Mctp1 [Symbiodinium natans]
MDQDFAHSTCIQLVGVDLGCSFEILPKRELLGDDLLDDLQKRKGPSKADEEASVLSFATSSWAAGSGVDSESSGGTHSGGVKHTKSDKSDTGKGAEVAAASDSPKPKKKAKAKPKAKTTSAEAMKAILVFETPKGKRMTLSLPSRPPGFSIRFPPMDVVRVVGPPASDLGIQVGWKLVAWGVNEDELHSKSTISKSSDLRDSFTDLIKSLPRLEAPSGGTPKSADASLSVKAVASEKSVKAVASDKAADEPSPAMKPGRWVYELDVTVERASSLRDADWAPGGGSSDPYCVVTVQGKGKSTFKTKVVNNNRDPVWNHNAKISDMHDGDLLFFEIFDHDVVGKHDSLGFASIGWEELQEDGPLSFKLPLESSGKAKASKNSSISVKVVMAKRKLEMGQSLATNLDGLFKLYVNIISARNLRNADHFMGGGSSDPYCKMFVKGTGTTKYTTRTINDKTDPEWDEQCVVPDFHKDDMLVQLGQQ